MSKLYNVGIYCRLSVDDASNTQKHNYIDGDESGSIENQRIMLSQFVLLQGWIETKVYCDDGYSGGHFHRPGFQQMIEDAKKGVIDLILCKDLSRLGRDYIEVGRYTDVLFPTWKCRFIALLDEIDTANDDNDMLHFRSLMNDYHLKDLSNKIKTVFSAKAMKSGYLTGRSPYGYVREESKSHLLIPDPQAAEVIRRIFAMRADGASYNTIARTLNTDGVMTANDYWAVRNGKTIKKPSLWYIQVVKNILRCEMYNGTLINNKKPSLSYKAGDKRRKTDECEWIRHKNAHEPLIDGDTWEKVQEIERTTIEKGKTQAKRQPALFGSKLFCLDCGTSLSAQTMGHTKNGVWKREGTSYSCHRHLMTGRAVCSNHTIGERPLKAIVLNELQAYAQSIALDETLLLEKLKKQMAVDNTDNQVFLQKELRRLQALLDESNRLAAILYEDKVAGKISPESFAKLLDKNEQERKKRQAQFDESNLRLTAIQDKILHISKWVEVIKKHTELTDITRPDVEELIDHIEVGESDYSSGKRVQEILIYWQFVGLLAD
ncbi:MAG: recombinase family protein [Eubacteriales bacterium]|nr:recombinase family protein [Eubacteriales bacterium]